MFSIGISCEKTICYPYSDSLTHRRSIPWNRRTYSGDENNVKWIQTIYKKLLYSYRWNNNHSFISTRLELITTSKIVINIIVYLVIKIISIVFRSRHDIFSFRSLRYCGRDRYIPDIFIFFDWFFQKIKIINQGSARQANETSKKKKQIHCESKIKEHYHPQTHFNGIYFSSTSNNHFNEIQHY